MLDERIKTVTIRMPEEMHREIKIKIAQEGVTLKDYLLNLIRADLKKGGKKK